MESAAEASFMAALKVTESQTGEFIAKILESKIEQHVPGGVANCTIICTDSASNCKAVGKIISNKYRHL